jgi:hypothetical protein
VQSRAIIIAIAVAGLVSGCGGRSGPPPVTFEVTQYPLTRLVPAGPDGILRLGVSAIRDMGFEITEPTSGSIRVFSEPLVIQSTWRGQPIARRILCGVGSAAASDPVRVTDLTNTIPIELRLGYEIERHAERTATTILFSAQGRRSPAETLTSPTMACTLTYAFVNELFAAIDSQMRASQR